MHLLPFRKSSCSSVFTILVLVMVVPRGHAQDLERTENGAVIHSAAGLVRVEACSDSVIHIVAGPAASHPAKQILPTVVQPCLGTKFAIGSDGSRVSVQTANVKGEVDKHTGSVRFLNPGGDTILSE